MKLNPYLPESKPNFWLSCLYIEPGCGVSFMDVLNKLQAYKVEGRPIWKPMHMQPVFKDCDFITAAEPVNEDIFGHGLCLPSDIKMTDEEHDYVIEVIKSCF